MLSRQQLSLNFHQSVPKVTSESKPGSVVSQTSITIPFRNKSIQKYAEQRKQTAHSIACCNLDVS